MAAAFPRRAPWAPGGIRAVFRLIRWCSLLVEGDAGFLLGRAVAGEAEVLTLAVAPEARRRGLARKLLARFVYQARLRGAGRAFLEVSAENTAAIALYESAGFAAVGRRKGYYATPQGARIDAIVLTRDL